MEVKEPKIEELKREIERLKKMNLALMNRVERSNESQKSPFSLLEENVLLSSRIKDRTKDLEAQRIKLNNIIGAIPGLIVIFDQEYSIIDYYHGTGPTIPFEQSKKVNLQFNTEFEILFKAKIPELQKASVVEFRFSIQNSMNKICFYLTSLFRIGAGQFIATIREISDLVRQEDTIKLQQAKMIEASKLTALGEMAGSLAHEINNPVTIISTAVQIQMRQIENQNFDPMMIKSNMEKILFNANRIAKIIKGLKTVSRSSDNEPFYKVALSALIDEVLGLCAERLKHKGVQIIVNVDESLLISCRSSEILQVLLSLFSNSDDALEELKEKWIRIDADLDSSHNVVIRFTDSGAGIGEPMRSQLMTPFFTTKEIGRGMGLGLSIAKGVIESHGGNIYYNPESINTQFVIELPIKN